MPHSGLSEAEAEAGELAQAADELFFAMRKARSAGAGEDGGLSLPQLTLLEPLAGGEDRPVGQLAAAADVTIPTATRMLQQLEAAGVVTRRRAPDDERKVLVGLTADGLARLTRLLERRRERQALAFARFDAAERRQLISLLGRLTGVMKEFRDG
ncbi:MarR family winged helix-turn-helix transcriptional regulator [Amycolatopsis sp. PS_44_ISF1]|uniref:MarR family winged helix-turn-helix transcriptional regulator n=1 Tax=Amycolatopsis sp. PS_44_ISF1 TaxID=2974917 RepID=UPI0028DD62FC|nr:MarR family winged helix-turn-helix transcriptional regulator [Amycolatopsis sp. PS_44_ISF1]MDT8913391.1 MarR family winged helix-turn-helix transcriptional regulator [Amycolatopsis sp. PS_44_ISF1]